MSLASLVLLAVTQMTIGIGRMNFDSVAKLAINRDVRSFTGEISTAGRSARDYRIYTAPDNLTERQSDQSGDVLVLVWADPVPMDDPAMALVNATEAFHYRRIIVFAREVDNNTNQTGPVTRYERTFPPAGNIGALMSRNTTILAQTMSLLTLNAPGDQRKEVLQLARGLATERLFFHSRTGRSIIVNGEIFHGNRAREVTNTYNFTITPRG